MAITNSILITIKKMLGIPAEDTAFDIDIIVNINSTFMVLHQLGVGPENAFLIEDDSKEWSDFTSDIDSYNAVKTYIYLKVKLAFDPSGTSFVIDSLNNQMKELEWRLMVKADPAPPTDPIPEE